jgi:hypothetical protein
VFPCAHRGYYKKDGDGTTALVFDPEARAITETNFANTFHKLSRNKKSYVVEWDTQNNILKCVIDGYYFEIYNHDQMEDWFSDVKGSCEPYYLCIQTTDIQLSSSIVTQNAEEGNESDSRTTTILASFANTDNYLDVGYSSRELGTVYIFTGLVLRTAEELNGKTDYTSAFAPFIATFKYVSSDVAFDEESFIAWAVGDNTKYDDCYYKTTAGNWMKVTRESGMTTQAAEEAWETLLAAGVKPGDYAAYRVANRMVNPAMCPVTDLLDMSTGEYSLRMIGEETEQPGGNKISNSTNASGLYAVALGKKSKASGEVSSALGNNTEASGKYSLATGSETKAQGEASTAFGDSTEVAGHYAIAGGHFTKASGQSSMAFGNGTDGANLVEASGEGSVALGNVTRASAKGAVAIGNNTKASGEGSFSAGNNTEAANNGAVALGSNTLTSAANQVVIGKYNKEDSTQAFIIANGDSDRAGTANKFTVSKTGNVKALGELEVKGNIKATGITNNSLELGTSNSKSSGSIKVYGTGETSVFSVDNAGNTTIAGATEIANTLTVTDDTKLEKALEIDGQTTLNEALVVASNKHTTLGGNLTVEMATQLQGTLEVVGANTTTLGGDLIVSGSESLKNNLTLASNTANDGSTPTNTLTIGSNQTKVSGALKIYGTADTTIFSVNNLGTVQAAGKIETNAAVTDSDTDGTLVTKKYVTDKIGSINYNTTTGAIGGTGKYVQRVTQTGGLITVVDHSFAASVDPIDTFNVPSSKAVADYVANIWTNLQVKTSASSDTDSLKNILLNAAYPIGSIYTQYIDSAAATPSKCPIADTLGGSWTLINSGTFLCAASSDKSSTYAHGKTGGSANAVNISHTHTYSTTGSVASGGGHTHNITSIKGYKTGSGNFNGFDARAGDTCNWGPTFTSSSGGAHDHSFTAPTIASAGEDGTNKNLPPYLTVYMWRRTA